MKQFLILILLLLSIQSYSQKVYVDSSFMSIIQSHGKADKVAKDGPYTYIKYNEVKTVSTDTFKSSRIYYFKGDITLHTQKCVLAGLIVPFSQGIKYISKYEKDFLKLAKLKYFDIKNNLFYDVLYNKGTWAIQIRKRSK